MSSEQKKEMTIREKEEIKKGDGEFTRSGVFYSPDVDIYETDNAITLLADLPGVKKEDLDIDVEDRTLTIKGRVAGPESRFESVYTEYGIGGYERSFKLGDAVDPTQISASLVAGVLTVVLSKADRLRPRKIEISTQ